MEGLFLPFSHGYAFFTKRFEQAILTPKLADPLSDIRIRLERQDRGGQAFMSIKIFCLKNILHNIL
jgi:hypothetical protein